MNTTRLKFTEGPHGDLLSSRNNVFIGFEAHRRITDHTGSLRVSVDSSLQLS